MPRDNGRFFAVFENFSKKTINIRQAAYKYQEAGYHKKALGLHEYNVERFANDMYGMWSQVRIVRSHIRDGNHAAADAALDKLLTLFSGQATLSREVYKIANKFSQAGNNQRADQLYQYIIGRWSCDPDINSRKSAVMSYTCLGLDAEAQSATQTLTNDFNDHPDLAVVLWQVAEADYDLAFRCESQGLHAQAKEYFLKVIDAGEAILNQWPDSSPAPEIYYILAVCYGRLHEYAKAIEYYQKVVDNWPDYEHAWKAQFLIAKMSKWLMLTGAMSYSEADAAINTAYERVLQRYPDSRAAEVLRHHFEGDVKPEEGAQK